MEYVKYATSSLSVVALQLIAFDEKLAIDLAVLFVISGILLPRTQSPERNVRLYYPSGRFSFALYNTTSNKKNIFVKVLFPAPRSNAPIRTYTSTTNRCIFHVQLHFIHFFSLRQSQNKFRFAHSAKLKRCKKQLMKFFHEIAVSASSACRSAMSTVRRVQTNASLGRRVAYTAV